MSDDEWDDLLAWSARCVADGTAGDWSFTGPICTQAGIPIYGVPAMPFPGTPLVRVDRQAGVSARRQVYDGLRDAILTGRLASGSRLPSTRASRPASGAPDVGACTHAPDKVALRAELLEHFDDGRADSRGGARP